MLIDILHVEDSPMIVRGFKSILDNLIKEEFHSSYSYKDFSNLEEFQKYMAAGNTSRLYFIDGNFKRTPETAKTELLFPEAVQIIKDYDTSAKIWLFSLEGYGAKLAQKYQTGFIDKASSNTYEQIKDTLTQTGLIPRSV